MFEVKQKVKFSLDRYQVTTVYLLDSDIKILQEFKDYFSSVFTAENTSNVSLSELVHSQQDLLSVE